MLKVLIFSRESNWFGGVVNFIDLLKKNFSSEIETSQFLVGRRKGKLGLMLRPFVPLLDAIKLFFHLLFNKYDCYHLNPSLNGPSLIRDGIFIIILRLLACKNIILCFHGWELTTERCIESSMWRKWLFKKIYCNTGCILVLAQPFKDWLIKQGADEKNVYLFTTMFDGECIENTVRPELKSNNNIILLFLSRFVREKGVYELLEAFKRVSSKFDNIKLIFAGTGPEEKAMKSWVKNENLNEKVEFKGYVRDNEKAELFKQSHIFVFPTYYGEGCPVSLLEAMAAGMAVITTSVGGIPHIIQAGKNGILLDAQVSADSVEKALYDLLSSPSIINTIAETNRIEAWEKYNAPVITSFFENIYKKGSADYAE